MNLKGKVVLITGSTGGIGSACAKLFYNEKATVILHYNTNKDKVSELHKLMPVHSLPYQADLTNSNKVKLMFDYIYDKYNKIDVLVANAGVYPVNSEPIYKISNKRLNHVINNNINSVFYCTREFLRILVKSKSNYPTIIIVGSTAAKFGAENKSDYALSKAAVTFGLTRTLKNEIVRIVPNGRVNAVCPGWTKTPMAKHGENSDNIKRFIQTRSLKHIANPIDIANIILFLSSEKYSKHITGEIITVAGGMEGRLLHNANDIDPKSVLSV